MLTGPDGVVPSVLPLLVEPDGFPSLLTGPDGVVPSVLPLSDVSAVFDFFSIVTAI